MSVATIDEQAFESEVLRSDLPVLVSFGSARSADCQKTDLEVAALAESLDGRIKVGSVDVDRSQRLTQMLRIQTLPTFIVFSQGRPVGVERGMVTQQKLRALVEPFLPRAEGAIRAPELAMLMKENGATAVDTRDAASFGRAHIPGAVHFPLDEIETRLAELHMVPSPVLYCRSGDKAKELSEKLTRDQAGVPFLEGGFLLWEAEMLPIERD